MSEIDYPTRPLMLLARRSERSFKYLEKRFGVICKLWKPREIDTTFQEFDDSLGHQDTPYFEGRLVMPFLFKMHPEGSAQMYEGFEDDQYLLAPQSLKLYRNALVQPQWSLAVEKEILLRIDLIENVGPTGYYKKATLVNAANRPTIAQDIEDIELVPETPYDDVHPYPPQDFEPQKNRKFRKVIPSA